MRRSIFLFQWLVAMGVVGVVSAYANSAPTLSVSGDRVVVAGETLRVTVTAADADAEDWVTWIRGRIGTWSGPPTENPILLRAWETNRRLGDLEVEVYGAAGFPTNPASGEFVLVTREEDVQPGGLFYPGQIRPFTVLFSTISSGWNNGSQTAEAAVDFLVVKKRLKADFGASALWGGAPLTVNFTSTTEGYTGNYCSEPGFGSDCPSYNWDFGDGETSTEVNPTHTFQSGTYAVKLAVESRFETSTALKEKLICAGCVPELAVTTDTLDFGKVPVDSTRTLSVRVANTGSASVDVKYITLFGNDWRRFSTDAERPILFAKSDATIPVTFAPIQTGSSEAIIQFDFGFAVYETVLLGQGVRLPPQIALTTEELDFGLGSVGAVDTLALTVANTGHETLLITSIDFDSTHFAIGPTEFAIGAGHSQMVEVIYLRRETGSLQDTLRLHSNAPDRPEIVLPLRGETASPTLVVDMGEVHFEEVHFSELPEVGTRVARVLHIANTGSLPFHIRSISVDNPHFDATLSSAVIEAGDSLHVEIGYTPQTAGTHEAALVITSNDLNQAEVRISLYGAALGSRGPAIEVGDPLDYGSVLLGATEIMPLIVKNAGTDTLTITALAVDSQVFRLSRQTLVVEPGRSGFVNITFAPELEGEEIATLTIYSDDLSNPQVEVSIRGVGRLPGLGPVVMDFNAVPGDQSQRVIGSALPGRIYQVQLHVEGAPAMSGWSAIVDYPAEKVRYQRGSFQASDFVPGLVPLVDEKEGSIAVGGAVLSGDGSNSGDGFLGSFLVEVLEGFAETAELVVVEVNFRRLDGVQDKRPVRSVATITTAKVIVALPGDFDDSGAVGFDDFFLFADQFGGTDPRYDLNGNGAVDFDDFFIFADQFGSSAQAKLVALAQQYLGLPTAAGLAPGYPNPFNSEIALPYRIAESEQVRLGVFDLNGQRVRILVDQVQRPGHYQISWNGVDAQRRRVASGIYLVRLETASRVETRKVTLLK